MDVDLSSLFRQYAAVSATIDKIVAELNASKASLDPVVIARRVREVHRGLDMGPATLTAAIGQVAKANRASLKNV